MNDEFRTIGYAHGEGYCVKCGKHFGYNDLHPQSICNECKSIPEEQKTLDENDNFFYCHKCGAKYEKLNNKVKKEKLIKFIHEHSNGCPNCN